MRIVDLPLHGSGNLELLDDLPALFRDYPFLGQGLFVLKTLVLLNAGVVKNGTGSHGACQEGEDKKKYY
jgi:hypothetical protein